MPLTRPEAIDEMLVHWRTFWLTNTPALNGGVVIPAQYDNVELTDSFADTGYWVEVMIVHSVSPQVTLGAEGQKRFRSFGQFIVVVHAPTGSGRANSDAICKVLIDGFRGKRTGPDRVEFREPVIQEVGRKDASWDQNFICTFDYDEIA